MQSPSRIRATPFLPSLIYEAKLGFDVKFDRPGKPLLVQFKLGEVLKRFRAKKGKRAPQIQRPFWRFRVNTAERQGQYDLLLKAEQAGAEVYYVAPRFTDWDRYSKIFQEKRVLKRSLMMRPTESERALIRQGESDGLHLVCYDRSSVHVCSEPEEANEVGADEFAEQIRADIAQQHEAVFNVLKRVYASAGKEREIRRKIDEEHYEEGVQHGDDVEQVGVASRSAERLSHERGRRLQAFRELSGREEDAVMAALGLEHGLSAASLLLQL